MKIPTSLLILLAGIGSATAATVNIQISQGANQATNFANRDGTVSNGLVWGLIVSTADNQFTTGAGFAGAQLGTSLNGTRLYNSDDYFFGSTVLTAQATFADAANPGKITILNAIQVNVPGTNPVATGNPFAIVWFDPSVTSANQFISNPTFYGILSDPSWVIPAGGATQNISNYFASSPDPVRLANIIPEPSSALLGLMGLLAAFRRR